MSRSGLAAAVPWLVQVLALTACAEPAGSEPEFPANPVFDYQLGGAYPTAGRSHARRPRQHRRSRTRALQRLLRQRLPDPTRRPRPLAGRAPRPGPARRVRRATGRRENWPDELVLDTTEPARLAEIIGPTVRGCAQDGYDAVELDNLDSYLRSGGALTIEDNLALATELTRLAHDSGLAVGQKNTAELATRVIDIEYTDDWPDPADACATPHPPSTVLRDRDLVPRDEPDHFHLAC